METFILDIMDALSGDLLNVILIIFGATLVHILLKATLQNIASITTKQELFKTTRSRQKRIKTLNSIVGATSAMLVWFVAVVMIMQELGISVAPLLTSAGIVGAGLAFGTQSIIKDFISGLFIIAEDRYKVDDFVELHGGGAGTIRGRVEAVNVRSTVVRTADDSLIHVPNGSIVSTSNKSIPALKAFVDVDIDSSITIDSFAKYITKLSDSLQNDESVMHLFRGPLAIAAIESVNGKKVSVRIEYHTTAKHQDDAKSSLLRRLAEAQKNDKLKLAG